MSTSPQPDAEKAKKAELRLQKLQLEIEDLKRSPARTRIAGVQAVLTLVLTLIVAIGGWWIQSKFETQNSAEKITEHVDDLYDKALRDFGSPSAPQRAGAAKALARYANKNDPSHPSDDRVTQTIIILVTRLSSETDLASLNVLESTIADIGDPVLPELADANRRASADFASAYGRYVGLLFRKRVEERHLGPAQTDLAAIVKSTEESPAAVDFIDTRLLALTEAEQYAHNWLVRHLEQISLPLLDESTPLSPRQVLQLPRLRAKLLAEEESATSLDADQRTTAKLAKVLDDVDARALGLVASSQTLSDIVRRSTKDRPISFKDVSLKDVVLLSTHLNRDTFLRGADLRSAYLAGLATDVDCSFCDLRGARLNQLWLSRADLTGASLVGASLRDLTDVPPDGSAAKLPNLTGADWWDAQIDRSTYEAHGGNQPPWSIAYKRTENQKTRSTLIAEYVSVTPHASIRQAYIRSRFASQNTSVPAIRVSYGASSGSADTNF